jgi:hypothetical protein
MVMWDLREKMVHGMSPDVMVDVVEPSVVPVKRCQASTKVAPFLIINFQFNIYKTIFVTCQFKK